MSCCVLMALTILGVVRHSSDPTIHRAFSLTTIFAGVWSFRNLFLQNLAIRIGFGPIKQRINGVSVSAYLFFVLFLVYTFLENCQIYRINIICENLKSVSFIIYVDEDCERGAGAVS